MYFKLISFIIWFCLLFYENRCQKPNVPMRSQKSQDVTRYMNLSIDPCDDFYEYACGNFKTLYPSKNVNIYPVTVLQQLEDKIDQEILKMLIQPLKSNENAMHHHLKDFYSSCTNVDQINRVGNEPIKAVIKDLGGMPLLDSYWDERSFNWLSTISDLKNKYNMDVLINLSVRDGERKNSKAFYLDPPKYQPMYKLFRSKRDALEDITKLLQKYSGRSTDISRTAEEVYNIEYNLYKNNPEVLPGKKNEYEESYNYQKSFENIDFDTYVSASVQHSISPFKKFVATNGYFENLQQVITSTPKKSIANYIMWNFIRQMNITSDSDKNINRRKFCLNLAKQYFPQVIGEIYSKPNPHTMRHVESDIEFLRNHLQSALVYNGFDWMERDRDVKSTIQHKLSNININYIKYYPEDVKESMPSLNRTAIQANHFLQNIFTLMEMQAANAKNKIYSDMNRKVVENSVESYSVFPSYESDQNTISIPKGMFNYPLYNQDFPNAVKFAQVGVLISREIIKSLTGGNDRSYRWVDRVLDIYYEQVKCFVEQYKNFKFGDGYLPENENQSENIADNGAVRMAFKAYLKWLMDGTISPEALNNETLNNVDFTNTQLFFIAYAQTYCSSLLENEELVMPDNKEFIPEKIRVNAALSNFEEFSIEFNCPTGCDMNAPDKCVFY